MIVEADVAVCEPGAYLLKQPVRYSKTLSFLTIFGVALGFVDVGANSRCRPALPPGACAQCFSAAASFAGSRAANLRDCVARRSCRRRSSHRRSTASLRKSRCSAHVNAARTIAGGATPSWRVMKRLPTGLKCRRARHAVPRLALLQARHRIRALRGRCFAQPPASCSCDSICARTSASGRGSAAL